VKGSELRSLDRFGVSAPGRIAMGKFGFTVDNVVAKAKVVMG
jgi:transketolase